MNNIYKTKKEKIINTGQTQGQTLHQLKESEEFIGTLVKRLNISKITITFRINSYKLLKKYPLLKHFNNSMYYFKNFFKNFFMD